MSLIVEVHGLEIAGRHGVGDEERRTGQTFLFDLTLEVPDDALSDRIEDAVDYRAVAERVEAVSAAKEFRLLEALAAAVADDLVEAFEIESVRVRVRKPGVRSLGFPAEWTAATAERRRG